MYNKYIYVNVMTFNNLSFLFSYVFISAGKEKKTNPNSQMHYNCMNKRVTIMHYMPNSETFLINVMNE